MTNDKKILDNAHEGNPVYKFLVFMTCWITGLKIQI
jgi:hypothetical protein